MGDSHRPTDQQKHFENRRQPGDSLFATIVFVLTVFLLSQLGTQTKWIEGTKLLAQPRFWPALSLILMLLFAAGYLYFSLRDVVRKNADSLDDKLWQPGEVLNWLRTLEYAVYFLIYVSAVPKLGYLISTLVFILLLTFRAGYRERRFAGWSLVVGLLVVILFKSLLQVKLPAGEIYDLLPEAIGGIMIRYF